MQDVIRFWLDRGVDGFRIDAIDRLVKDAELRDDPPASAPFALPLPEEYARLEHLYSANSPDIRAALVALREAAGDALLVGEVYLPAADTAPYLDHFDAVFAFELFHSPWEAGRAARRDRGVRGAGRRRWRGGRRLGALQPRLPAAARARGRGERACGGRAAADPARPGVRLPGRGDRPGATGPVASAPTTAPGATPHRHPMQWEPDPATAGFTSGTPWLPPVDPQRRSVSAQAGAAGQHARALPRADRPAQRPERCAGDDARLRRGSSHTRAGGTSLR